MKKLLTLAAAAILVGAGCNADVDIQPTPTPAQDTAPVTNTMPVPGTNTPEMVVTPTPEPTPTPDEKTPIVDVAAALTVAMKADNFSYDPKVVTALPGQTVNLDFSTVTGFHDITIDGVTKVSISTGKVVSFTAPTTPGSYPYYCSIGSHRSNGMEGTLIVK